MMLVKTVTKQSSIHGTGLLADQFIAAGTATWRFDRGVDRAIHPEWVER